jgi:hypothetical protein
MNDTPIEHKFNFSVHERLGSEVYAIPEGHAYDESLINEENLVTTEDGLKAGMKILCTAAPWAA